MLYKMETNLIINKVKKYMKKEKIPNKYVLSKDIINYIGNSYQEIFKRRLERK